VKEKFRRFGQPNVPESDSSPQASPLSVPEAQEDREEEGRRLLKQKQDAKARLLLGKTYRPRREEDQ
jgi:hypothetical protein